MTGSKKNYQLNNPKKISLIEPSHKYISIVRQCELLGLNRSRYYYQPRPVSECAQLLLRRIDEIYTEFPYYGSPKITAELQRQGMRVNHKAVERLMRVLGLQAVVPKKNTSQPHPKHPVYAYLLNGLDINRPNQVWGTDITYVRASGMWFYLAAILDWHSRYVVAWRLSPGISADFCRATLEDALRVALPEIHNSDQGSQFTAEEYTNLLKANGIQISMDGRGRCFDNIFTERLWRTVKYEEVYLHDYGSLAEARVSLDKYFQVYNHRRVHQSLGYQTPAEVYFRDSTLKPSHRIVYTGRKSSGLIFTASEPVSISEPADTI